jgi:predicted ATPase
VEPRTASIEILLLGPVALRLDQREVSLGGSRQRALLALLALRPGQVLPAGELIEDLWAGDPPDGAETTLRSYVSRLRHSFDGAMPIGRTDRGYILGVAPSTVDALEFERLIRTGREMLAQGSVRRARRALAEALDMWRGRPFGEVGGEGTLEIAANQLEELRLLGIEGRIEADLDLGRSAEVVDELEALVREHPFRERLWRHLMLALYQSGRQADALAAYHRARAALDEHLGIEPTEDLRALEAAILRQEVSAAASQDAPHNLPIALTSFIGRAAELEAVSNLLRAHRLVTLTGVGGVGKTRLALEVTRRAAEAFFDGVWFVDLAPLGDPGLVASSLATALGLREGSETSDLDALAVKLGDRELLIVLDNCEHVREACAELATVLLARASNLHILATSRVTLGVAGEVDYAVPPLTIPTDLADPGAVGAFDAVNLFLERARARRPSLLADPATLAAVARIVSDLDGLPLAIELAAARAKALTITDIAARLDDRFRFLVSWRRLSSARHRTLAEAMAWSFDFLDPEAQGLLADLSVFAGGFDLDAAAKVSLDGDRARALDIVERLVDASLVILEAEPREDSRYRLLETVRQYGAERLAASGRTDAAKRAHATFFAGVAEASPTKGSEQARGMARLDLERDNLRVAIDYAVELGDPVLQRRITAALWRYWQVRGDLAEGYARLRATLAMGEDAAPDQYPNAVLGAGMLAWAMGRYNEGKQHGIELLRLAAESGSLRQAYVGNRLLGNIAFRERDFETSDAYSVRALDLARQDNDPIEIMMAELNHAVLLMDWGRMESAVDRLEQALEGARALGHAEGAALALLNLGEAAFLLGRDEDARARFDEARDAFAAIGFRAHVGHAMQGIAAVLARAGDAHLAAELLGRAGAVLGQVGAAPEDFNPGMVAGAEAAAREVLGDDAFDAAYSAGWTSERSL